jgi:hypothetical protein
METATLGIHQSTYDAVFQHPIARNLQWHDVRTLLSSLAETVEEPNGNTKFSRNGQTLTVHPSRHKDVSDIEEMMQIRHFLERSAAPAMLSAPPAAGANLLVVIDHREARIFHTELQNAVPTRITPLDPDGSHRHLHSVDDDNNGTRLPEPKAFYDAIAKALATAEKILLFGTATGASSAMNHLVEQIQAHHPDLAKRIIGTVVINEKHLTEPQLLAEARKFYGTKSETAAT